MSNSSSPQPNLLVRDDRNIDRSAVQSRRLNLEPTRGV